MALQGDVAIALTFLEAFQPGGPWLLVGITPDRTKSLARMCDAPTARAFLDEFMGKRNLYFTVNPVTEVPTNEKGGPIPAERQHIASLSWLYVDLDRRAGEDPEAEDERALRMLCNPPNGLPVPTCIVFSGGGYQGFWKLAAPIQIAGDVPAAEDAKLWNIGLEIAFGADNCHNVNRIMRIPGTINKPTPTKLAKGRTDALAELIEFHADRVYDLAQFKKAPPPRSQGASAKQQAAGTPGHGPQAQGTGAPQRAADSPAHVVSIPDDVPKLADIHELDQWNVPDRLKVIAVQGSDPDGREKPKDNSRSGWLFDFICNCIRFEVPDDRIYAVITDADFAISSSVLDKGSAQKARDYALRQIRKAHDVAEPSGGGDRLAEMNVKFAVIGNYGGKCRVMEELWDDGLERSLLTFQSFEDFRNRHSNQLVHIGTDDKGNDKWKPLGGWWLDHFKRRQYDRFVFSPERPTPENIYNLWQGFAVEPSAEATCEKYLTHLRENVCGGVEEYYKYLVGWMAMAVQHPGSAGHVAVVLRGPRGAGKGKVSEIFGQLFGRHFLQVASPKHLVGNFNVHLRDCIVLFGDECFFAGDKQHESVLKTLITERTMMCEPKGVDAAPTRNRIHLMMASNEDWTTPVGDHERRFFILDVRESKLQDHTYFAAIDAEAAAGGLGALLHLLQTFDLSTFNVRSVPRTDALRDQQDLTLSSPAAWWLSKLMDGQFFAGDAGWAGTVSCDKVLEDWVENAKQFNVQRRSNQIALRAFLERACGKDPETKQLRLKKFQGRVGQERPYFFDMPSLDILRDEWDKQRGTKRDWPAIANLADLPDAAPPEEAF